MQVRFEEHEFELIDRPLFAEFAWVERQAGVSAQEMTGTERQAALFLISLRRTGVMLTWEDIQNTMSPADFEEIKAAAEAEAAAGDTVHEPADPQPAGAEAGPVAEPEAVAVEATLSTTGETATGS